MKNSVLKKDSYNIFHTSEYKDLKSSFDSLQKESQRKDVRIESLVKEAQAFRNSIATLERDLRLLNGKYDHVVKEKMVAQNEKDDLKKYCDKLELHASNFEDASVLTEINRIQLVQIEELKQEIKSKESVIDTREQRISNLEYEYDSLKRFVENQKLYENRVKGGVQSGREMMRSLYYDISKKQVEVQNLSIVLSRKADEFNNLNQSHQNLEADKQVLVKELEQMKVCVQELEEKSIIQGKEVSNANLQVNSFREVNNKLQKQIEDLSKRLSEVRIEAENANQEKLRIESECNHKIATLSREKEVLHCSIDQLKSSLSQKDTLHMVTERKLQEEWKSLSDQKQLYFVTMQQNELLESQLALYRSTYADTITSKDESIRKYEHIHNEFEVKNRQLLLQLEEIRQLNEELLAKESEATQQLQFVLQQRDEAVEALQQCMAQCKTLNRQYLTERSVRLCAESKQQSLEKEVHSSFASREHAMNVVLDALQAEKERVNSYEKLLSDSGLSYKSLFHDGSATKVKTTSPSSATKDKQHGGDVVPPPPPPRESVLYAPLDEGKLTNIVNVSNNIARLKGEFSTLLNDDVSVSQSATAQAMLKTNS